MNRRHVELGVFLTVVAFAAFLLWRAEQTRQDVREIRREVVTLTPCLRGEDRACRTFLNRLLQAATPRQIRKLRGGKVVTPRQARRIFREEARRDAGGQNGAGDGPGGDQAPSGGVTQPDDGTGGGGGLGGGQPNPPGQPSPSPPPNGGGPPQGPQQPAPEPPAPPPPPPPGPTRGPVGQLLEDVGDTVNGLTEGLGDTLDNLLRPQP